MFASGAFERVIAATIKTAPTATAEELEQAEQAKKAVAQFFRELHTERREDQQDAYGASPSASLAEEVEPPRGLDPADREISPSAVSKRQIRQSAEVAFAATLSVIADATQARGWRQHRYIRCPEIHWALHASPTSQDGSSRPQPGLLASTDPRVTYILSRFRDTPPSILDLRAVAVATPQVVASALWHISAPPREPREQRRLQERLQVSKLPPPPTWMFARVTPDEHDEQFWEVLYGALGAPPEAFEELQHAPTGKEAAQRVRRALSQFEPQEWAPSYRSPDVLVLVGVEHAERSWRMMERKNPLSRPLALPHVLDALKVSDLPLPARLRPGTPRRQTGRRPHHPALRRRRWPRERGRQRRARCLGGWRL